MVLHLQPKKPAIARKPIIITKNEAKNSFFRFDCVILFSCDKKEHLTNINLWEAA
jgi:hypothetical protein